MIVADLLKMCESLDPKTEVLIVRGTMTHPDTPRIAPTTALLVRDIGLWVSGDARTAALFDPDRVERHPVLMIS